MYEVLVIGAEGMVGNIVFKYLQNHFHVLGTSRGGSSLFYKYIANRDRYPLRELLSMLSPGALVINCVAILDLGENNNASNSSLLESIEINTIFPHFLAEECASMGNRLIHVSTDAVFGSNAGHFSENMCMSPNTVYGMTKALGELSVENAITIRCSLVGPCCGTKKGGLWNWISNSEKNATLYGYINSHWTGVTTLQFARICHALIDQISFLEVKKYGSVHHLCANEVITKYDLIFLIAQKIRPDLRIEKSVSQAPSSRQLVSKSNQLNKLLHKVRWDLAIEELEQFQLQI